MSARAVANTVYGPTCSDAVPWRTFYHKTRCEAHVVPGFEGRRHVLHLTCWCHPTYSTLPDDSTDEVIMHNVAQ